VFPLDISPDKMPLLTSLAPKFFRGSSRKGDARSPAGGFSVLATFLYLDPEGVSGLLFVRPGSPERYRFFKVLAVALAVGGHG